MYGPVVIRNLRRLRHFCVSTSAGTEICCCFKMYKLEQKMKNRANMNYSYSVRQRKDQQTHGPRQLFSKVQITSREMRRPDPTHVDGI
jgi:hypothetical protein